MVGNTGKVIAADLQDGMLERVARKIEGTELASRIRLVKCNQDNINVTEPADFILTFYMVHEVPDKASLFRQLDGILKDGGQLLIVEPKLFHVSREDFASTIRVAESKGFHTFPGAPLLLSWSAILRKTPADGTNG
jgi:ubiquinone/menaquinone biosynthesis C-methylase UbiE